MLSRSDLSLSLATLGALTAPDAPDPEARLPQISALLDSLDRSRLAGAGGAEAGTLRETIRTFQQSLQAQLSATDTLARIRCALAA